MLLLAVSAALLAPLNTALKSASAEVVSEKYIFSAAGTVTADADTVTILAGIDTYALTLEEGMKANDTATQSIEKSFVSYGTVKEEYYSAYPAYDKIGYNITRQLCCSSKNLSEAQNMIAVLTKAGANKICAITYSSSREEELKIEALKNAVKKVKEKAAAIDGKLKLIELTEFGAYPISCTNGNSDTKICIEAHVQAVFQY